MVQEIEVVPSPEQSVVISLYAWSVSDDLQSPFSSNVKVIVGVASVIVEAEAGEKLDGTGGVLSNTQPVLLPPSVECVPGFQVAPPVAVE